MWEGSRVKTKNRNYWKCRKMQKVGEGFCRGPTEGGFLGPGKRGLFWGLKRGVKNHTCPTRKCTYKSCHNNRVEESITHITWAHWCAPRKGSKNPIFRGVPAKGSGTVPHKGPTFRHFWWKFEKIFSYMKADDPPHEKNWKHMKNS